ncbi:uncharacterized protein LOC122959690 [Acropora millepora]|uniref:uncharacterized protein LOC122959690 n=1 Tax=Acropora millepora TaxID=45264 RepID=UPI001CF53263|nr:uncharacterized protein LOC122959690 [Acropora millepora]
MHLTSTILYICVGFSIFIGFTGQQALIQRSEDQHHGYFEVFLNHSLNVSPILSTINVSRYIQCAFSCLQNVLCFSFNVATVQDINSKQYACQLLPTDKCRNPDDFVLSQEFHHYATPNPCESSPRQKGRRSPLNHKDGHCANGSFGGSCHPKVYKNCSEAPRKTGIYHILDKQSQTFPVFCDQVTEGGGWTMVFKVVNGITQPFVGPLWDSSQTLAENVTTALIMNTTVNHLGHYKNRIVNNWEAFDPQKVRVVLYKNGSEVLSMSFNAVGTNRLNWFSQAKLLSSPWTDLKTASHLQHFDISGSHKRYFEITRNYGGCLTDQGWLVVGNGACPWETHGSSSSSSIRFSKLGTGINWNLFNDVGVADVLTVFIR